MQVRTLDESGGSRTRPRFRALMVATFAALALVLAAMGVFEILRLPVQQRWRDFGVRMALGATPRDLLALVARSGARVSGVGGAIGLIAAALLGRSIASVLFGVRPRPGDLRRGGALLVSRRSSRRPCRRCAAKVDPVVAFRSE